jgi:hypothetical protein
MKKQNKQKDNHKLQRKYFLQGHSAYTENIKHWYVSSEALA